MTTHEAQTRSEFRVGSRTVVAHEGPPVRDPRLIVLWLGGTPHSGELLSPHLEAASALDVRLVAVARSGFGGSDRDAGRSVGAAAADVVLVADRLGITGYSGGGPHALAVGAQAGGRVVAVATFGSLAPFVDDGSWFSGMHDPSALVSARDGRAAREARDEDSTFDPDQFTSDDYAALDGPLASLADQVARASEADLGGSVDDDLAFVRPWAVDLADITAPVQLVHGTEDRIVPVDHARRIADACTSAEVVALPGRGHVGVLLGWRDALDRILTTVTGT
jgi:pimeloyl-ACP methyl ester carboxylesterase